MDNSLQPPADSRQQRRVSELRLNILCHTETINLPIYNAELKCILCRNHINFPTMK